MSRIFISHSGRDNRQATALRAWLVTQDPPLANEIFLDNDPDMGMMPGERWKNQLISANSRCEAVICLLSKNWESAPECRTEYRTAENMGKQILCARLEHDTGAYTGEWQHCDLFADGLPHKDVEKVAVAAARRWPSPKRDCTSCVKRSAARASGWRTSFGHRPASPTGPPTAAGNRSKSSTPACSSAAMPKTCGHWTSCAACAPPGSTACSSF